VASVTVVVLTKNGGAYLDRGLLAVTQQVTKHDVDILAVDSGSTDGTEDVLHRYSARIERVPASEFSHSRTRMLAACLARGTYVVFLSQDAQPANRDWLERLVAPLEAEANVATTCSRILPRPDCNPILARTVRDDPAAQDKPQRVAVGASAYWSMSPEEKRALVTFHNVSSCVRRSELLELGLPDLAFAEDLGWAHRTLLAGYTVAFEPGSLVLHSHAYTPRSVFARAVLDGRANWELFGRRNVSSLRDVVPLLLREMRADGQCLHGSTSAPLARLLWMGYSMAFHAAMLIGFWMGGREAACAPTAPLFAQSPAAAGR
jgi:rhamnosyltransferase